MLRDPQVKTCGYSRSTPAGVKQDMTYFNAYAPNPSPARAGEGCRSRGEGCLPRAYALGYVIPPLTGLQNV